MEHARRAGADWPAEIRTHQWYDTPLGAADQWTASLTAAVDLAMALRIPAAVLWGAELIEIPNAPMMQAFDGEDIWPGRAAITTWPSTWPGGDALWSRVREGETATFPPTRSAPTLAFSPLRDEAGAVAGILVVADRHTEPRSAEIDAEMRDLRHRSGNAIAWVRSIAKRAAATSENLDAFIDHLDGRIDAVARLRDMAAFTSSGMPLSAIVGEQLYAATAREGENASVEGPDVVVAPRAAESLALAFHELAMNAVKFGALASPAGRIDVSWDLLEDPAAPRLIVDWKESGVDEPGTIVRRGFGMEVIEQSLRYELGAVSHVIVEPDGLRCTMDFELSRLTAAL